MVTKQRLLKIGLMATIPVGLFWSGVSFMWLGLHKGMWLPNTPPVEDLTRGMPSLRNPANWTHWMVNAAVETVREDAQWWTKFLVWVLLVREVWWRMTT